VQRLLRRHGLATRRQRLLVLEHHSATQAGLLTERTRQTLWRLRHGRTRHVAAERPGELVCLDTFYIGHLKGVGKVWQITACDAASAYGVARILPALSPRATAAFLRHILVPAARRAGWSVARVLTDRGNEFRADFAAVCATLGIRQTRIKTRPPWTNGFVERLQQTILTEHWRLVFPPLLHHPRLARSQPPWLHAVLQLRPPAPRLSSSGPHPGHDLPRRGGRGALTSCHTLGPRKGQHQPDPGQPRDVKVSQRLPENPFALTLRVIVRRIEEVDPAINRRLDKFVGPGLANGADALEEASSVPECHGSEAEFRNQETRIAERCVFHDALQLLSIFVDVYL